MVANYFSKQVDRSPRSARIFPAMLPFIQPSDAVADALPGEVVAILYLAVAAILFVAGPAWPRK